jgi:putative ABC transport system permease protein
MTNIAWRNLARERLRLAMSVGGVAFAVLLILLVRGLYVGFLDQATSYIRSVDTDVWVAEGSTAGDFFHSVSLMPAAQAQEIDAVPGAGRVTPLLGRSILFQHAGKDRDFFLIGVDPATGVGGPEAAEQGRRVPRPGEIVVDRVFADNVGLDVGDRVRLPGVGLRVAGVARGGNAIISQFAWAALPDVAKIFATPDIANYFLVKGEGDVSPAVLAQRIRTSVPNLKVLTADEFADANTRDLSEGFLPIIWILVVIAFVIGTAVIGLTIYTATLEKRREYGVLKAIGFSNRRLLSIVWRQSLSAGAIGFVAGVLLTMALAAALEELLPSFVTTIRPVDVGLVALAALAMVFASSFLPVRPVTRLDPAEVFRV